MAVGYVEQHYGSAVLGAIAVTVALWGETMISKIRPTAETRRGGKPAPAKPAAAPAPAKPAARKPAAPRKPRTAKPATAPATTVSHPAADALIADWRSERAYL